MERQEKETGSHKERHKSPVSTSPLSPIKDSQCLISPNAGEHGNYKEKNSPANGERRQTSDGKTVKERTPEQRETEYTGVHLFSVTLSEVAGWCWD